MQAATGKAGRFFVVQFADLNLARKIEAFEAESARFCTEALAMHDANLGATWIAVAGGCAAFSGKDSPLTQAVGVGMAGAVDERDMARIEALFFERGAAADFETCPMAHPSLFDLLGSRGYRATAFSNVLYRVVESNERFSAPSNGIRVRPAAEKERRLWAETIAEGFSEEFSNVSMLIAVLSSFAERPGAQLWLAECEGTVAGGAALAVDDGMAGLFGAATLDEFRGRGVQQALFQARLAEALRAGATLAYTIAVPGSASHRNAERAGFRVAYTRVKFTLPVK